MRLQLWQAAQFRLLTSCPEGLPILKQTGSENVIDLKIRPTAL